MHLAIDTSEGKLSRYLHILSAGASVVDTDYGIDLAERMGIRAEIISNARVIKAKILRAAPATMDESKTGSDMGRLTLVTRTLQRRLSSLQGASVDDKTLRLFLDKLKSQIPGEQLARLQRGLEAPATIEAITALD